MDAAEIVMGDIQADARHVDLQLLGEAVSQALAASGATPAGSKDGAQGQEKPGGNSGGGKPPPPDVVRY